MLEFYDIKIREDEFIFEGSEEKNYFIYVFEGNIKIGGQVIFETVYHFPIE
tara:strand:+ start:316 stop:468 length:153 start_codon:yes stop_codon:yes gene_type:complete